MRAGVSIDRRWIGRAALGAVVVVGGQNNWPFGAAIAFVLMTATLALSVASNVVLQRRYRR